jgi:signal transduction histidine kinase
MAVTSPSLAEPCTETAPTPLDAESHDAEMRRVDAACWALDVSGARTAIAAVTGGAASPDWIEAVLAGARIADVNQRAVHLVGPYDGRARMIGRPITAYWPSESRPALAELIVAAVAAHPPGTRRAREITSLAFSDPVLTAWTAADRRHPDIVFLSFTGTMVDDRSLWALRASDERYRNLIHYLPCALLQVDSTPMVEIFDKLRRDGITDIAPYLDAAPEFALRSRSIVQVTDANRNAVQLFAAGSADRLIGAVDFLFVASPDTAKRVITAHFDGLRNYAERMRIRTFAGDLRDVELSVTYPTPPERLDVTLLSLEDVTERLRTEAQLRQLQADYTRTARISMLGELATSIAHEVNQPLAAIVTNAETSLRWLSRDDPNLAKVGLLTTRIAHSARHASDIVQRIRGMAARGMPERVPLDLNRIVDEALLFVRHEIESRAIALSVRLRDDLPRVRGDRVQLQQVVVNLLLNAVQAIAQGGTPGGRIDLGTARAAGGAVVFAIHDSGPGIAEEDLDRIFGSFFTTKEEGIGIGLAICQSIVAAHGGTIAVSNHPDGGALFRCSLPAAAED